MSRTSARKCTWPSSYSTGRVTDVTTRLGVSLTSQRIICRQNISWLMSCTGCSICQRQSPPVAKTAVRPRPYFCVINNGSLCAGGRHFRQHQRAWLGLSGFLKIHQVRQLLPALHIGVGIVLDARDQAVAAGRRQLSSGGIAMEGVLVVRQANRQQIGKRRLSRSRRRRATPGRPGTAGRRRGDRRTAGSNPAARE